MALFGRSSKAPLTPEERQAKADRWALIGATLQDVGGGLGGGDVGAIARTQKGIAARAEKAITKAAEEQFIQQMLGANTAPARQPMQTMGNSAFGVPDLVSAEGPQARVPQAMDPRAILEASRKGVDVPGYMAALKAFRPDAVKVGANEAMWDPMSRSMLFSNRAPSENDYTLSPGSIRFGPDGKPIANAPFAPQIITASPESNVFTVDKNPPPPTSGGFDAPTIDGLIGSTGGQITSAGRTPERNAQVGGVANSYHLSGQARDVVPPRNMSVAQYAQSLRGQLPGMDVLDRGSHVHIEPGPVGSGGGVQVLQRGQPKPKPQVRTLSPQEAQAAGFLPGTIVQQREDGSFNTVQTPNNQASPRKAETDLRKEFETKPEVKDFKAIDAAFRQIKGIASQKPTAQNDMSLVFSFMKMLDPGSVVREGEFASAQNSAGVPDQVRNAYNKAMNGQILNPKQRAEFTNTARTIYGSQRQRYESVADSFRGYASGYGVSADNVVPPPVQGAKRAPNGSWHIEDPMKKGSFPEIRRGGDGVWRLKSANGKILEWED